MVFRLLENALVFPDTELAEPDGLLAIGGDLSVERLLIAYGKGIFPWFSEGDPICWYAPHHRCVIFPEQIKVSKSMSKLLNSNQFQVTWNTCFGQVISNCAEISRKGSPGTWITKEMQKAYMKMHYAGHAASVEVWDKTQLVGGLYGVVVKDIFCGESMFSLQSNASKVALIWLCRNKGFRLIDCQLPNDHLMSMGASMIDRAEFLSILGD